MAESEVVKVGRGGAGNLYTRKDIADMSTPGREDPEAQPTTHEAPLPNPDPTEPIKPTHIGRGGAGNFYEPPSEAQPTPSNQITTFLPPSSTPTAQPLEPGIATGRGGAGNWYESASKREKREAEAEQRRREEEERLERMVRESIEARLTKPARSYGCGSERGVRVGKSRFGLTLGDEAPL